MGEGIPVVRLPGLYGVSPGEGSAFHFAVNVADAEREAAVISEAELSAAIRPSNAAAENPAATSAAMDPLVDRGAWRWFLLALVLVSLTELFVGNRTVRH